jgi:hypothetical protein
MKFEDEDPSEVKKAGSQNVDRSQGAARAISVRVPIRWFHAGYNNRNHSLSLTPASSGVILVGLAV